MELGASGPARTLDEVVDEIAAEATRRFGPFLAERVAPDAVERDSTSTPIDRAVLAEAADLGLLKQSIPSEIGGEGRDLLHRGVTLEQVGYLCVDQSFPLLVSVFEEIAREVAASGRQELAETYGRRLVESELLGAFAYSDGTDPFTFKSKATTVGGGYRLDGYKPIVTGAALADLFIVYVAIEGGDLAAFVVERSDPGVTVMPRAVSGMRAAGIGSITMEDVRLPAWRMLYEEDGLSSAQRFLNARRVLHSCAPLGCMRSILERSIASLHETVRYGSLLSDAPNVQATLGRMYAAVETSRSVTHRALSRASAGLADAFFDPVASAAKHTVTELAIRTALDAMRLAGGEGYISDNHYERWHRDFTGLIAGAGTQDTLEMNLGALAVGNWEAAMERSEER